MSFPTGTCPKCDKTVSELRVETNTARIQFGNAYKAVVFKCPSCNAILSAGVDWVALGNEIAEKVVERLKR